VPTRSRRRDTPLSFLTTSLGVFFAVLISLAFVPSPARADDEGIDALNKQALEAFDGLNFDQAKTLLEQALSQGETAGLGKDPSIARTHLDLGMLLIAGFQKRDDAIDHFKAALTINPRIVAPAGLFNPEVQAAFDEAKEKVKSEQEVEKAIAQPRRKAEPEETPAAKAEPDTKEAEEEAPAENGTGFFLSLGIGSGLGITKGHLDANKDLTQNGKADNSWTGGLAGSQLGHIAVGIGYFVTPDLLLSLDGRIQVITGTTQVFSMPSCEQSPCKPPSTAIAVLAKANWYLTTGPLRPFLIGGLGGGAIREVVKPNVMVQPTGCGPGTAAMPGSSQCVDTVTGGPFLIAAGAGLSYDIGSISLLASLTANVGIPKFMLNVDATLGLGLHL
jgi:hypothetical protein